MCASDIHGSSVSEIFEGCFDSDVNWHESEDVVWVPKGQRSPGDEMT